MTFCPGDTMNRKRTQPIRRPIRPQMEALEDRTCPAVDIFVQGRTLFLVGDKTDNVIQIQADRPHEIQVVADGVASRAIIAIDEVVIQTGEGNDTVEMKWPEHAVDVVLADTGNGNDVVRVTELGTPRWDTAVPTD